MLGLLVGRDNDYGITGIVPDATARVAPAGNNNIAAAIDAAASVTGPGDVILLELQTCVCGLTCSTTTQAGFGPLEYYQPYFDAIAQATALGVVVVEPAGNGAVDLDSTNCLGRFQRANRDSWAVMVGAGTGDTPLVRLGFSNYGSRVDVQGQGWRVATLGYGSSDDPAQPGPTQRYTDHFAGTSSASAIVAGAAASLQGAREAAAQDFYSPFELRRVLVGSGTQPNKGTAYGIGPMPDLARAIAGCGNGVLNDGETCDEYGDSALCNDDCTPSTCGDGQVNEVAGESCDDANVIDGDGCSGACVLEGASNCWGEPTHCWGCLPTPWPDCRAAKRSKLKLIDSDDPSKQSLAWDWTQGESTSKDDFGMALGMSFLTMCIYEDGVLSSELQLGSGNGSAYWSETGTGFRYKEPVGYGNGLRELRATASSSNRAKLIMRMGGAEMERVGPGPWTTPLTIQLRQAATTQCFESTFGLEDLRRNTVDRFYGSAKR